MGAASPSFADVANPPAWARSEGDDRAQLAKTIALLASRAAIDSELNGARLAALAEAVGEDSFDQICEADVLDVTIADIPAALPRPEELERLGSDMLAAANDRPALAQLAAIAQTICAGTRRSFAEVAE